MEQQSSQIKTNDLEKQLIQMGFQLDLVKQAIAVTNSKDTAIQYIVNCLEKKDQQENIQNKQIDFQDVEQEDYKMVFLVRMDLKMGLGKMAAQVAHAALRAFKQIQQLSQKDQFAEVAFFEWTESGQKKIVLKVQNEAELFDLYEKAKKNKLNTCYIRDAGLTQIASGSITVAAIGPSPGSQIDAITKHLKLM